MYVQPWHFEFLQPWIIAGPALVVVPVVPWNHSIFEKGAIQPLDFWDLVKCNQSIFKYANARTTGFKLIAPTLHCLHFRLNLNNLGIQRLFKVLRSASYSSQLIIYPKVPIQEGNRSYFFHSIMRLAFFFAINSVHLYLKVCTKVCLGLILIIQSSSTCIWLMFRNIWEKF